MAQVQTERDATRDDCLDFCDLACEEKAQEMRTVLAERGRLKLRQIDDTLTRIESREYGLCELCGLDITEERLKAIPFALLCCDCQQERERESKPRPGYEEQEGYMLD
jgi:DnaK suppressor protein